jgi:hypothetical protein
MEAILRAPLVTFLPRPMRDRFIAALLDVAQEDETQSGDVLFTLGERDSDEGIFVLQGAVKITRANGDVRFSEAPDILGELQLFSPGGARTATVETVYGGAVLRFSWHELGAQAKSIFNAAELSALRQAIRDCADSREKSFLTNLENRARPQS